MLIRLLNVDGDVNNDISFGISIQQGLTKGSIPSDILISELLNLGSLTPSSVQNLESDELKLLVTDIQDLPNKFSSNPNIDRVESRFLIYAQILEWTKGIGQNLNVEKQSEYLTAVQALEKVNYDPNELNKAVKYLKNFITPLISLDDDGKTDEYKTYMSLLTSPSTFNNLISMDSYKSSLLKHEVLVNGDEMFGRLKLVSDAVELYQKRTDVINYSSNDNSFMKQIGEFINTLNELAQRSKSLSPALRSLYQLLVSSHHVSGNRELTLTSGLPNGYTEMESISADLSDPWIQSAVDGQSEALSKTLEPLRSLIEELKNLGGLLTLEDSDSTLLSSAIDETVKLTQYVGVFDEKFSKSFESMKITSSMSDMEPSNRVSFNPLLDNILLLSKHINALHKVVTAVETLKKDEAKHMKNVLEIAANPTPDTAYSQLDKLRASPSFKFIVDLLRGADESIGILTPDKSKNDLIITETAKKITPVFDQLETYLNGLPHFLTQFDSLSKISGIDKLGAAVSTIQKIRKTQFSGGSFENVVAKVEEVKTSLASLQNSIAGMKGKDEDSKLLMELNDVLKDSQTVGSATRVFRSMEKTDKDRIVVLDQVTVGLIQNKMKQMDSEDQKTLKELLALDAQLAVVYGQVGGVKKSATSSPTSDLSSLHPIFLLAKNSPGTSTNFLKIGRSVVNLSKDSTLTSDQQKAILEIKKKLETLDSFGLDFTRHHSAIDESKKSLEQLDVFFSSFKSKVTAIPVKPRQSIPGKQPVAPPSDSNAPSGALGGGGASIGKKKDEKSDGFWDKYGIWIIVVPLLVLIGSACFIIFCLYRRRIQKRKRLEVEAKEKDEREKLIKALEVVNTKEDAEVQNTQISYRIVLPPVTLDICQKFVRKTFNDIFADSKERRRTRDIIIQENCETAFRPVHKDRMKWGDAPEVDGAIPWTRGEIPLRAKGHFGLSSYEMFDGKPKPVLHANILKLENAFEICMMQSPQAENLKIPKYSTILPFWLAVLDKQCQFIVMWEDFGKDDVNCARYFPMERDEVLTFEKLSVKCGDVVEHTEMEYTVRTLTITYPNRQSITLRHIFFVGWPVNGAVPTRTDGILEIIRMIESSTYPVFMHCATGIGPCTVVPFAMLNRERILKEDGKLPLYQTFPDLRLVRGNAISNIDEFVLAVCVTFRLVYSAIDETKLDKETKEFGDKLNAAYTSVLEYLAREVQVKINDKEQAKKDEESRRRREVEKGKKSETK
ncbi:hypothetical protein GCK72_011603 [Caenorhabditis remanei]|uniref:Tyrosine-protein phosphatase domain-containing protein n=1 Tax=Caenorhabditis remanei TaxID=31234 RepID=A0A6A5H816_CAERE|nr:hypothetical protein GCK72_011603 [Caenorhabditis remanei]KAF1763337.1 hypothetical protein GCK72_011603 [Caenorhabditis remanei]